MTVNRRQHYDLEDNELVSVIDELPLWSAPFGLKLLESVRLRPDMQVLDVGCGLGFPLLEVAQRLGPSCSAYGIDPWQAAVDRTRKKIAAYDLANVSVSVGHAEELPFADGTFDLIVSNNGLNNVADLDASLAECFRASRPGAQLVTTMNLASTMIEFYEVYEAVLIDRSLHDEVTRMRQHIAAKRPPLAAVTKRLERAGFAIRQVIQDEFCFRYVDGTAMLEHFLIRLAFLEPWQEILAPADRSDIFDEVERRLNQAAREQGELRLSIPFVTIDCERLPGAPARAGRSPSSLGP